MTEHIEKIIQTAQKASPPEDFTSRVMGRVMKSDPRPGSFLYNCLCGADSHTECSLCFLVAGFYYLIIGVVIMIGFDLGLSTDSVGVWIRYQPLITILTAFYLIVLGIFSLSHPRISAKVTTPGILFFVGFVVANALLVRSAAPYPYSLIFLITLSVTGIVVGILYFIEVVREGAPLQQRLIIRNNRGFSLLEVITILVVIGIIAAIIASRGISTSDVEFQSDVDRVKSHLRYAQSASLNSDSAWGIDFTGGTYSLYKWDTAGGGAKVKIKIPGEDSTDLNMPEGSSITQTVSFSHEEWGAPSTDADADPIALADITLTFTGTSISRSVTIYKNTGYIP